jgi:type I restriction enzyme S subunit
VLVAYGDLIENNMRRIAILEQMAQRIFEEWFVHFRAPGCEGLPLVDSPLGPIPQGWEVKRLDEIVIARRDATRPGNHLAHRAYLPIDCIAKRSLYLPSVKPWTEAQSSLVLFERGDVLFGAMRPYFHKVCVAPIAGITRSTCFVLRPRQEKWRAFATMAIFQDSTIAFASTHTQGATIPYAVWDGSLANLRFVVPPDLLLQRFNALVDPILSWLQNMHFTQTNLRAQRDLLLPKLVSGEIDVSAMPAPLKEAAE